MKWDRLLNPDRRRKTTSTDDHRVQFERDYDRSVFSSPVKRLQDKTQVFPLDPNDAVRTRLTHSLEVSSVARGLAMNVAKWLIDKKEIKAGQEREIEAIAATCGLIHDLGNPPFGHSGEQAIRDWFKTHLREDALRERLNGNEQQIQDFLEFEGNAQSLRLVTRLQILADHYGLNLTYGTLSASCKYTAPSHEVDGSVDHAKSKPGYFWSEQAIVEQIRAATGTGNARNPVTFLVEAADDIVYSVADMEDAVKKGVVSWRTVREHLEAAKCDKVDEAIAAAERILKAGGTDVPTRLPDQIHASAFRTGAIGVMVQSVTRAFKDNYDEVMNGSLKDELIEKCDAAELKRVLKKQIGQKLVYCATPNLRLELMGRRIITDLMDIFWEGCESLPANEAPNTREFGGKAASLLSQNYVEEFQRAVSQGNVPEQYGRLQLLCDYVCGMTDSFAKRLHTELLNG